jgi:hypothetical protein
MYLSVMTTIYMANQRDRYEARVSGQFITVP